MGNKETIPTNIQSLKEGTWVQAGQNQQNALFSNVNPYRRRLLANIMTHQLIEEYELNFITEEDYNSYLSELTYRQIKQSPNQNFHSLNQTDQQHSFVFPIRYFVNKSRHQMCTTIHTGYLYADKVDLRLKQINDIPFDDLLYMYKATLIGFKILYEKVGYFDIVEQMIFITKFGEVKVWMNANLAKNYPNYDKNLSNDSSNENTYSKKSHSNLYGSQADMIRKLILLIEKNSDEYQHMGELQHQFFSQFLSTKNIFDKLSFQHSLQEFENYLHQNNFHSPNFMKSIPELFSPQPQHNMHTNYELSHVNEITNQHLTQIKKTFQPMETIPENSKLGSQINKTAQYGQISHQMFNPSQIPFFQHPNLTNINTQYNRNLMVGSISSKVVRPKQPFYTDMRQSQNSQSIQNNKYEQDHLKISSNSINNFPRVIEKPSLVNILKPQSQTSRTTPNYHPITYQSKNQINPLNFIVQNPFINNSQSGPNKPHLYQNIPYNSFNSSPIIIQNQPIQQHNFISQQKFIPISSFSNTINSNYQYNKINQQPFTFIDNSQSKLSNQNINTIKLDSIKQNSISKTKMENLHISQQESDIRQSQDNFTSKSNNSKIKYFTTKDTYQLDEQIANDLQKFLGLKVK